MPTTDHAINSGQFRGKIAPVAADGEKSASSPRPPGRRLRPASRYAIGARPLPPAATAPGGGTHSEGPSMTIQVGDKIPSATLRYLSPEGPKEITTDELFRGKKVALFAVPGAFTPACSQRHLPGFVERASDLKAKGVDTIACVAVNDPFVMGAWGKAQNVGDKVMMLADGSGDFTRAIGMELDLKSRGLGERSDRYSMLVEDGGVKAIHREKPGQFEVSSAEAMLKAL